MRRHLLGFCALGALALATACNTTRSDGLESALYQYSAAVRWQGIAAGVEFVDPALRAEQAMSPLDLRRLDQYRVTGYQVLSSVDDAEGHRVQQVQIALVNNNTLSERVIGHREVWRYDEQVKRWWLIGGLPQLPDGEK